jgi:hypothetical protein
MMLASIAAGVMMNDSRLAKAAQPATPVNFDVPAAPATATPISIPIREIPLLRRPRLHAELASPEEMTAAAQGAANGARGDRHASDLRHRQFGHAVRHERRGATARGVAVIDDKTSESDLDAMGKAGFRGIRLNLATGGVNDPNVAAPRFTAPSSA